MKILKKIVLPTTLTSILWAVLVIIGGLYGWWHRPLTRSSELEQFIIAAKEKIQKAHQGSLAMALIQNGTVVDEYFYSVGDSVTRESLFQVASLSKWISSWGVLSLVEAGKLDLDTPVSTYLTRWQLPKSDFDNDGVSVRRLLSHTAGLIDELGYSGFKPGQPVQSLESSLTMASDASPGKPGMVLIGLEPGTEWKYSGGGYTLLQLLIEEVSEQSFNSYMIESVFQPLRMDHSTFDHNQVAKEKLTTCYGLNSEISTYNQYTSLAATSLYTNLADMEKFLVACLPGNNSVISSELKDSAALPHAFSMRAPIWGMGTMLFAPNNQGSYIIGHDGKNEPAINSAARIDPSTGDGIIILETGSELLATEIASEWVLWHTGNVDFLMFMTILPSLTKMVISGLVISALLFIALYLFPFRKKNIIS